MTEDEQAEPTAVTATPEQARAAIRKVLEDYAGAWKRLADL